MKKLLVGLIAVLMAGLFALPGVAQAQETGDGNDASEVTVEGRGWLAARGTGDVDITMGGEIRLRVDGDVTITDNSGDMRVRLRGATDSVDEERTTNVTLTDFRGAINVRGSDFTITVDGEVRLHARGRGEAYLVGQGTYKTRNGDRYVWDGMVRIGTPEVQPA